MIVIDQGGPESVYCGVKVGGAHVRAPGLVPSSTSGTVAIDHEASRLRRLRRSISVGARLHELETTPRGSRRSHKPAMVTLTYREAGGWTPADISAFLQRVRVWLKRRGQVLRYVWVCELQKRGAPHYHVMLWLPRGLTLPKPDKQGWWTHGSTRIEWARKPVGYLCKYASKLESKESEFPPGMRLHGRGGLREFQAVASWFSLPSWARSLFGVSDRATRCLGGGLVSRRTGFIAGSPFRVWREAGSYWCQQLFTRIDGWLPDVKPGPFSWLPGCGPSHY